MAEMLTLSRVVLRNFKSIRHCDLSLGPITFLVGPNGAGKSNFVEALRFLSLALNASLEHAINKHSGFRSIVHRGPVARNGDEAVTVTFDLSLNLLEGKARYYVELGARGSGPVSVIREECSVKSAGGSDWFTVENGTVAGSQVVMPIASADKLYLVNAAGLPAFEQVHRALSAIEVYNPVPDEIRGFQPERQSHRLDRAGSALAEVIFRMKTAYPERLARITDYLQRINPAVHRVDAVCVDAHLNLRFELNHGNSTQIFSGHNISDGMLRALAVLVALFQETYPFPLIVTGLEEPEAGIHPAAVGVLFDAIMEASRFRQIIVTSHSPDLLDRKDIPDDSIQAVLLCEGRTIIGEIDGAGKAALSERLYTVGELMRIDQLRPENTEDCAFVQ